MTDRGEGGHYPVVIQKIQVKAKNEKKKKNRPFEYSKLDDKNERREGTLGSLYPSHGY